MSTAMRWRTGSRLRAADPVLGPAVRPLAAFVLLAVLLLGGPVAGVAAAQDRDFRPVTDAMLADPDPADSQGIRNWRASAYHPATGMLCIPIHPTCVKGVFNPVAREPHPTGDLYHYGNPRWTGWQSAGRLPHPKSPDHDGHLVAMDIETGEVRWRHSMRLRSRAAALTTAGGLVVTADGDGDRYLYILDVATGDELFRTRMPSPVQGFPITYAVGGRQYLAVPVGGGRVPGAPNSMYVFALPQPR